MSSRCFQLKEVRGDLSCLLLEVDFEDKRLRQGGGNNLAAWAWPLITKWGGNNKIILGEIPSRLLINVILSAATVVLDVFAGSRRCARLVREIFFVPCMLIVPSKVTLAM